MITQSVHQNDSEASVISALRRMLDAGQRMVVDRIELARVDILAALKGGIHGAVLVVVGIIPAAIGWLAVVRGMVLVMEGYFTAPASLAIIGALNVVAGVGLVMVGVRRMHPGAEKAAYANDRAALHSNNRAEGQPAPN